MELPNDKISKLRFSIGVLFFVLGFTVPLLIPFVASSDLPPTYKTVLSGLLLLGIPEVCLLIAVAVLGKPGYMVLKSKIAKFFKPLALSTQVSLTRYRIGLIMFCVPSFVAWISPYIVDIFPVLLELETWHYIASDAIFFASFFVLGGDFWDKFAGLFKHKAKIAS